MGGASVIEDTWLRARAGEHGFLSGKDAGAIACDALSRQAAIPSFP